MNSDVRISGLGLEAIFGVGLGCVRDNRTDDEGHCGAIGRFDLCDLRKLESEGSASQSELD
jgi:hypothetical protein